MLDAAGLELRDRLFEIFERPFDAALDDQEFDRLARASFAFQFERNAALAAFCTARGRTPSQVAHWSDIPAVPTTGFKYVPLVSGDAAAAEVTFRTSGTTEGQERRGTHHVLDRTLYERALLPAFAACLLPDHARPNMISLIPPFAQLPDSSLAYMVDVVLRELGSEHSAWVVNRDNGIDEAQLHRALDDAAARNDVVLLLGTSFSFVHWLDSLEAQSVTFQLPAGSRLMDTGGYKGRSRTVPVAEMLARYDHALGIPPTHCVNEYGMTELLSQQYERQLRDTLLGREPHHRLKISPPWLRTRVVDPETLRPVPDGQVGLLQHFDLANIGSVIAVQTEDLGVQRPHGLELLGRAEGAPPRGCSIAMDDLLRASRARP